MADQQEHEVPCIPPSLSGIPSSVSSHAPQIVIAHRGASAHLPEHTIEAYRLALELGADYIEPDLVATKDDELIAIHSMDLSVTTNVQDVFPDRQPTYSKYFNQTGYWSFDFTLDEIQQLRVNQRLPAARSTAYDGLFTIPSLTDILNLIKDWRKQTEPLLLDGDMFVPSYTRTGIYAELKDYPWLLEDTGKDLVDLLFKHMERHDDLWDEVVMEHLCYTQTLKVFEYRLPPFVLQSFESKVLESFTEQWKDTFSDDYQSNRPVPPRVLLVGQDKCLEEIFWFNIGQNLREYVTGVGPDKECLRSEWRRFMDQAIEHNLVVHPWTIRPELEFVRPESNDNNNGNNNYYNNNNNNNQPFASVQEELEYFFCTVKVHGIFSESVSTAVVAANKGCPNEENARNQHTSTPSGNDNNNGNGNSATNNNCNGNDDGNLYFSMATFVMGAFLAVIGTLWLRRTQSRRGGRRQRVPTQDMNDDAFNDTDEDDLEMI